MAVRSLTTAVASAVTQSTGELCFLLYLPFSGGGPNNLLFADDYNRTVGNDIGNGWTEHEDSAGDLTLFNGGLDSVAMYHASQGDVDYTSRTSPAAGTDYIVQANVLILNANGGGGLWVSGTTPGTTGYAISINRNTNTLQIWRESGGYTKVDEIACPYHGGYWKDYWYTLRVHVIQNSPTSTQLKVYIAEATNGEYEPNSLVEMLDYTDTVDPQLGTGYGTAQGWYSSYIDAYRLWDYGTGIRLTTGSRNVDWDSNTWYATGGLLSFEAARETTDLSGQSVRVTLDGVSQLAIAAFLAEDYVGGLAELYLAHLDSDGSIMADPVKIFAGYMNHKWTLREHIGEGENYATVSTILMGPAAARFKQVRGIKANLNSHTAHFSTDTFMRHIMALEDGDIGWGVYKASGPADYFYDNPIY